MKFKYAPLYLAVSAVSALLIQSPQAIAQQEQALEEVIVTGTRSQKARTVSDSPVPVDVLNSEEMNSFGNTADITDNMRSLIPSYTATPATGDGSAFIRPTSLRGTSPDQALVLINGKRRHRSALVTFFAPAAGNGVAPARPHRPYGAAAAKRRAGSRRRRQLDCPAGPAPRSRRSGRTTSGGPA